MSTQQIQEELNPELRNILDSDTRPVQHKHKAMAGLLRTMLKKGVHTGIVDAKPKKGTSRAVYFPSEPDPIKIDGQDTHMHSVLKVAYPGELDSHNDSGMLFGEHQNLAESDHYTQQGYGMLRMTDDGHYKTNHDGILAPVIHSHDEGHYLQMAKIDPIKSGDFRTHTKTDEFPKGISHDEFYDACNHEHGQCNGYTHRGKTSEERIEQVKEHPLVANALSYMFDHGAHPGDFRKPNMGVWTHPVTGTKHIVLSDYGFSDDLAKHYGNARKKKYKW